MKPYFYSALLLCAIFSSGSQMVQAQQLLDPYTQSQFVHPLPIPSVLDGRKGKTFEISITQFEQHLGLKDPLTGKPFYTTVWGYNGSYPGPTILAQKNRPIKVYWRNHLIDEDQKPLPHLLPIDLTVHWALMDVPNWERFGVPIVTHLHGGLTESESDGLPEAWYTPFFLKRGKDFKKGAYEPYFYSNQQDAATIWYHDHALGITRLNVYAGLAGFYLITDVHETKLIEDGKLPPAPYDIGLAIQDRMFDTKGQLVYPYEDAELAEVHSPSILPEVPSPSILPEFFGDFILVNGKIWPVLEVEPRPYRFRILNGSDSRFYNLSLSSGQQFVQIGSDAGLLPSPYPVSKMLIGTGERKDVIIDFSSPSLWGQTIILQNDAVSPYPDGDDAVDPLTTGRIMAFKVTKALNKTYPITSLPAFLRSPIKRLDTKLPSRKLILFEATDEYGRLKPSLGTVEKGVLGYFEPITENPKQHSTEVWEIYNETMDAHTIHLHMVSMQLVNRQKFSADIDPINGKPTNINLEDPPRLPLPDESGWKDTWVTLPGEVTRVIARFDLEGLSAWHCHILSHEDHEMMRPYFIRKDNSEKKQIVDATEEMERLIQLSVTPNPFRDKIRVQFKLPDDASVKINIYNSLGTLVAQVYDGNRNKGVQQFVVDGSRWTNGTYLLELTVGSQKISRTLLLQK